MKSNAAQEPGCQLRASGQTGGGQTGDGKGECQRFRSQRLKMDWNG